MLANTFWKLSPPERSNDVLGEIIGVLQAPTFWNRAFDVPHVEKVLNHLMKTIAVESE